MPRILTRDIGGVGLAQGYWRDPERTAASFITHPDTGQRLYRTGDIGRYHPDGVIEFLGRQDHQVKINGYRIELGEIEATLTNHPAVKEAITTATQGQLTAYITTHNGTPGDLEDTLRLMCQDVLPSWMVPRHIVTTERFPLSANGKVDRSALARLAPAGRRRGQRVEPRNPTERVLHDIWRELLRTDSISVTDNLLDLGGDSLLALQVISRAAAAGVTITPREFFANPSIAGLAAVAAGRPAVGDQPHTVGEVRLLPRQAAFLSEHPNGPSRWNYAMLFELTDAMDRTALRVALRSVLRHHEGLRISFHHDGDTDEWSARINDPSDLAVPLTWIDISRQDQDARQRTIRSTCADLQDCFRLDRAPLFHLGYFCTADDKPDRLFLVGHWLIWDNYSVRVFLEDLISAYGQVVEHGEAALPAATPVSHWADGVQSLANNPSVTAELSRWRELAERPGTSLPPDGAGPNEVASSRVRVRALSTQATARLLRPPVDHQVTVPDVLLAAIARAIRSWTGTNMVRIDVDGHGRDRREVAADPSRTIGRLSIRYPLDIPVEDGMDLLSRAEVVADKRVAVPANGDNFDVLAYLSDRDPTLHGARAAVVFNYLGRADGMWDGTGLRLSAEELGPTQEPHERRSHLLEFLLGVVDDQLLIGCGYSANCHTEATVDALMTDLQHDLETALSGRARADADIALPPGGQALQAWFRTT